MQFKIFSSIAILSLILFFSATNLYAATDELVYSGYAANSDAVALSGAHDVEVNLYSVSSGGTAIWTEAQANVNFTNGFFTIPLCSDDSNPCPDFGDDVFLGLALDGGAELSPRTEFYGSIRARVADVANSLANSILGTSLSWTAAQTFDDVTITNLDATDAILNNVVSDDVQTDDLTVNATATVNDLVVTGSCTGCGGEALPEGVERLVATIEAVDMAATADYALFTIPTGERFIPTRVILLVTSESSAMSLPFTYCIGTNASNYDNIASAIMDTTADDVNEYLQTQITGGGSRKSFINAGETIRLRVGTTISGGAAEASFMLYGIYL